MSKLILCLDFDDVVHSYTSKWVSPTVIPDDPVPGAFDFIQKAMHYFEVHIFSSRSHEPSGADAMKAWFYKHLPVGSGIEWIGQLHFPLVKPPFFVGIDDRVLTFKGQYSTYS
jgi:hypothetical protein